MNSSPAISQISRSSCCGVGADAARGLLQPPRVELDADLLGLAQDVHERQLDVVQQVGQAALVELLALLGREVVDEHGAGGVLVVGGDGQAALLGTARRAGSRGGRGRAGRRASSVSKTRLPGTVAERLGVVGDDGAVAGGGDQLGRVVDLARERVAAAARRRRSASAARAGSARPRGPRAPRRRGTARRPASARDVGGVAPVLTGTVRASARLGARDRLDLGHRERLLEPPQRVAQLPVAEDRAQVRAVGRRVSSASRSRSIGTSRTIVASCLDIRAASACSIRFCLRLAPEISSTLVEHASRGRRTAGAARRRSCRRCRGRRGCCRWCRP